MSRIDELIAELCPDGVVFRPIWQLTTWDKKFNAVERFKQPEVRKYRYLLANEMMQFVVDGGDVKLLTTNDSNLWTTETAVGGPIYENEIVAIPWGGNAIVQYFNGRFVTSDNRIAVANDPSELSMKFLYYFIQGNLGTLASFYRGSGIKHPNMSKVLDWRIPVPPLEVQREIVRILDQFTQLEAELEAELEARRRQYEYYRGGLLAFSLDEVETVELSEAFETRNGYTPSKSDPTNWLNGTVPWFRMEDIRENGRVLDRALQRIPAKAVKGGRLFPAGSLIFATSATIGEHALITVPFMSNQRFTAVWPKAEYADRFDMKFLYYYGFVIDEWCRNNTTTSSFASVDMSGFKRLRIPIPPIETQGRIASQLSHFDALVNDLSSGLPAELAARRKQYEYYRDKLLTFKELAA